VPSILVKAEHCCPTPLSLRQNPVVAQFPSEALPAKTFGSRSLGTPRTSEIVIRSRFHDHTLHFCAVYLGLFHGHAILRVHLMLSVYVDAPPRSPLNVITHGSTSNQTFSEPNYATGIYLCAASSRIRSQSPSRAKNDRTNYLRMPSSGSG